MNYRFRFRFRVWVKTANSYISEKDEADIVRLEEDGKIVVGLYDGDLEDMIYLKEEDLIVEQCTGLIDRYGKMIFEGDILATSNKDKTNGCDLWEPEDWGYTKVLWDPHALCFTGSVWFIDGPEEESVYNAQFVSVVGNIHETPELLQEK